MKILNIIWKFSTGGIGKCFLTYAALAEVDSTVEVKSLCIDPQNCIYDRKPLMDNDINRIEIRNSLDFSWVKKLATIIKEEQPDFLFCHGFNGPVVVQIVKSLYRMDIPMVCSYHGLYHAPTRKKQILSYLYNRVQTLLYQYKAKKIILVENYSKSYLLKAHVPENKMVVVHNGIPLQDLNLSKRDEKFDVVKIGLASRLDSVKGIEFLLKAIPLVKLKAKRNFIVEILGDGPLEGELKQLTETLKIQENVHFLGYQNDIPKWLDSWDIFCLPSLFEYHSIALLEAMRAGKAIVASKVGGNEESVTNEDQALTVQPKSPEALADALIRIINDESLRFRLGSNARKRFEMEFTEEIMKKNLVAVFRSLKNVEV